MQGPSIFECRGPMCSILHSLSVCAWSVSYSTVRSDLGFRICPLTVALVQTTWLYSLHVPPTTTGWPALRASITADSAFPRHSIHYDDRRCENVSERIRLQFYRCSYPA